MATSGSVNFVNTRDDIIKRVMIEMCAIGINSTPTANQVTFMAGVLNEIIKSWQGKYPHVWTRRIGFIFPEADKFEYKIGNASTDDRCFSSYVTTTLTAASAATDTVLDVVTNSGFSNSYLIGITLDDGTIHWTTVSSSTSTTITIASGVASAASSGNRIYAGAARITRPVKCYKFWREHVQSDNSVVRSELDYIGFPDYYTRFGGSAVNSIPTQVIVDGRANINSTDPVMLRIAPTANSTEDIVIGFTYDTQIEDFDAATDNPDIPVEYSQLLTLALQKRTMKAFGVPESIKADIREQYLEALADFNSADADNDQIIYEPHPDIGFKDA